MNLSEDVLVTFRLKISSIQGNLMSDEGRCMSLIESSDNKHSVSFKITLENVKFSDNKFSSKGLLFLDIENGNQDINLQKVKFIKKQCICRAQMFLEIAVTVNLLLTAAV